MGILPLQFEEGQSFQTLGLSGFEVFDIEGITNDLGPRKKITVEVISQDGSKNNFDVLCRIDTPNEIDYYKHDGILQFVLRSLLKPSQPSVEKQTKPTSVSKTQEYRVLFKGEIAEGQELGTVKKNLTQVFKTSPERIEKLFTGRLITLNQNIDYAKAKEYSDELTNAGALCTIEPMPKIAQAPIKTKPEAVPSHTVSKVKDASKSNILTSKNINITKASVSPSIHSNAFLAGWVSAAIGMMLLPVLYIFLVLYVLNTTIDLIWDSNSLLNISIIIGFIGILLVAALVKPLFAPPSVKKLFIPISRKKEPALYMFVEKIVTLSV